MATQESNGFNTINREFYVANPAAYFGTRWKHLMIEATHGGDLEQFLADGMNYEGLTYQESREEAVDDDHLQLAYVVTESQVLYHHASEALIRLFLAHTGRPDCPWIEIVDLQAPNEFNEYLDRFAHRTWDAKLAAAVGELFSGDGNFGGDTTCKPPIVRLMRRVANDLRTDKKMYNSMKHGLAVLSGETSFALIDEASNAGVGTRGPGVIFLESERNSAKARQEWRQTMRGVGIRQTLWFTALTIRLMNTLWEIARYRYTGERRPEQLQLVSNEEIDLAVIGRLHESHAGTRTSFIVAETICPQNYRSGRGRGPPDCQNNTTSHWQVICWSDTLVAASGVA